MTRRAKATMQQVYTMQHLLSGNAEWGAVFLRSGMGGRNDCIHNHRRPPLVYIWSFLARVNSIKRCIVEFGNGLGQGVAIARFIFAQLFE